MSLVNPLKINNGEIQQLQVGDTIPNTFINYKYNQSVALQTSFVTEAYLIGSSISLSSEIKAGTRYHCIFEVTKTAAGTVAPIIRVKIGINASTADATILTFTFLAQTAVVDVGTFEFFITFRTVGAGTSAVISGIGRVQHSLTSTGLQNLPSKVLSVVSSGFNSTVSGLIIGLSVTAGTSAAWTVQLVQAELTNLQ